MGWGGALYFGLQGFGSRVARSVENFEHVTRLEEMAKKRMSKRVGVTSEPMGGLETGNMQGHYLRDLIISEATDWQVLTLHLAVHMQQLRAAIGSGASNAGQVCFGHHSCISTCLIIVEVFTIQDCRLFDCCHGVPQIPTKDIYRRTLICKIPYIA